MGYSLTQTPPAIITNANKLLLTSSGKKNVSTLFQEFTTNVRDLLYHFSYLYLI